MLPSTRLSGLCLSGPDDTVVLGIKPMEMVQEIEERAGLVESVASQEPGISHTVPLGPRAHTSLPSLQKDAPFLLHCP